MKVSYSDRLKNCYATNIWNMMWNQQIHRDATRRDRASEMSDDEVKQEVKEEHINIKVRDMVRARASDARDDASATRPTSRVVCDFEMTTNDGIWTTGSTRT